MASSSPFPRVFVISGPSGVGKGTICAFLRERLADKVALSVSATSRPARPNERDGVDYHFRTREEFERMIRDHEFVEYAEYNGNYYGTPVSSIRDRLAVGASVLLEIEVQGAMQVKQAFHDACLIFIDPPSMDALAARLAGRGTNDSADIQSRLKIAQEELDQRGQFDHVITNDDLDTCQQAVLAIIEKELAVI